MKALDFFARICAMSAAVLVPAAIGWWLAKGLPLGYSGSRTLGHRPKEE